MNADLVYIIPYEISFGDLQRDKFTPSYVYHRQTTVWILDAVKALEQEKSSRKGNGIAAFAILLMFFEPHGQYILGIDSEGQSKKCFSTGFQGFVKFVPANALGAAPSAEDVYKWARCGLFHSTKLANKLLVDTVDCGSGIFTKNQSVKSTLVSPWLMKKHLENYVADYCKRIKDDPHSKLATNFNKTFDRLIRKPMEYFCG